MAMTFKKAERKKVYLKVGISGASGSGKTFSALRVATGIAKKCGSRIAMISTEKTRSLYYGSEFDFDILELDDYTPETYMSAIDAAISAGYEIIIIDSFTHCWQKLNELHSQIGGNSFTAWGRLKPRMKALTNKILSAPAHMLVLSRAKTDWAIDTNNGGKSAPTKLGVKADTVADFDYELTLAFMLNQNHLASVENGKDNTRLYSNNNFKVLDESDGEAMYEWANSGTEYVAPPIVDPMITPEEEDELSTLQSDVISLCKALGGTKNDKLMTTLKKFSPSGNPKAIKELSVARECLEAIKALA